MTIPKSSKPVHPLLTLQPHEVSYTANIIRRKFPGKEIIFRIIAIKEPDRADVTKYLEAERAGTELPYVPRRTYASYQFPGETTSYEDIVDLSTEDIVRRKVLPLGVHPPASQDDMRDVQELVMSDPLILAEIERLKLPEGSKVVPEAWPYGKDSKEGDRKQFQVWFFLGSLDPNGLEHPSSNHFAHPLDFSAVVDDITRKVTRIDRLPMGAGLDSISGDNDVYQPQPDAEYATELQPSLREDVKPIIISQPEGVSFQVHDDQIVTWQKWRFHLDFNWREGVVLRDVSFDGRPVFYRLALAEMTVPYADPRSPYHRKSAYDLGEGGAGNTANDLKLGCDCLGAIRYFDRWVSNAQGAPVVRPNCICMHEVDTGIGWKHTNYRNGRAEVTRSRELVIQTVCPSPLLCFDLNIPSDFT
jgi:Cu2+-containing amine oxidase